MKNLYTLVPNLMQITKLNGHYLASKLTATWNLSSLVRFATLHPPKPHKMHLCNDKSSTMKVPNLYRNKLKRDNVLHP